nr:MAG TPA: hypothetical protein [Microviridae sp.]
MQVYITFLSCWRKYMGKFSRKPNFTVILSIIITSIN